MNNHWTTLILAVCIWMMLLMIYLGLQKIHESNQKIYEQLLILNASKLVE